MFKILVVEDNPADVAILRAVLEETTTPHRLTIAADGEEAIKVLHRAGKYADVNRPDLVLLDINLPKLSGHEVLLQVKTDDQLMSIPVIIFSSSTSRTDIDTAFKYHANSYVKKPNDLQGYYDAVRVIESFWLSLSQLPSSTF